MIWPNAIKYVNNPCQVLKWSTLIFKQLEHICSNFNTWGRKLLTKNSLIRCSFYSFNHCFFWLTNHCFNFIGLLLRTIFVPFLFFFVEPIFFNSISLHSFIHSSCSFAFFVVVGIWVSHIWVCLLYSFVACFQIKVSLQL